MAMFKVGQRVRIIGTANTENWPKSPIGREGCIVSVNCMKGFNRWIVKYSGLDCSPNNYFGQNHGAFRSIDLEPLTDPKADAFIASIKSLRPYEEPLRTLTEREMDKITGGAS